MPWYGLVELVKMINIVIVVHVYVVPCGYIVGLICSFLFGGGNVGIVRTRCLCLESP